MDIAPPETTRNVGLSVVTAAVQLVQPGVACAAPPPCIPAAFPAALMQGWICTPHYASGEAAHAQGGALIQPCTTADDISADAQEGALI